MPAPTVRSGQLFAVGAVLRHEECWAKTTKDGKPGISVLDHCLNVGCVAEALLALLTPQLHKLIPPGAATLAALHDIGKVSPGFQVKSEAWLVLHKLRDQAVKERWGVRLSDHAKISQFTTQSILRSSQFHRWASAVGAHHGRIKGERVMVSDQITSSGCPGAYPTCRSTAYQIYNQSATNPGTITIGENLSAGSQNCTPTVPNPQGASCSVNPFNTNSSAGYADDWSVLNSGSTQYSPSGCGLNVTDQWQWCPTTPYHTYALLTGSLNTNSVTINGYTLPSSAMPVGTVIGP